MEHIFAQNLETVPSNVTEFTPRSYQINLYEKAVQNNTILYLPTGTGKTYIAIMLLKHLSADVRKPYKEDGKRTIFVVNTALVMQQIECISRHTDLNCKGYNEDMQVDFWQKEQWMAKIETNQVLVMTSRIFLDLLSHGYMKLNKVNLIVFDECHIAVSNHPMRQIMQKFEDCPKEKQPRVLAMSATLFNANINLDELENAIKALEITFRAKIATVKSTDCIQGYFTNPKENIIKYEVYQVPEVIAQIDPIIDQCVKIIENIKLNFDKTYKQSSTPIQPETTSSKLIAMIKNIKAATSQTGIYGGSKSALSYLIKLESLETYSDNPNVEVLLNYLITQIILIRKMFDNEMDGYTELQQLYNFTSDQIHKMFEVLIEYKNKLSSKEKFCCIIIVKERFMIQVVYHILKILSAQDEHYSFLSPDYITGFQDSPYRSSKEVFCIAKWNKNVWQRFKSGSSNCIVMTDVDEGIDVPACTLIIQYDMPVDFRGYVRARHNTSHYIILMPNNDLASLQKYLDYKNTESKLNQILVEQSELRTLPTDSDIVNYTDFAIEPYVVERNGIIESCITEKSAINLINTYCQTLPRSKFVHLVPVWQLYKKNSPDGMILYQISLKLPNTSPVKTKVYGDFMKTVDRAKRSAAMKSCIQLHKQGALTDKLLPVTADDMIQNMDYLSPNWIDEDNYFGTYKKEREHKLEYPTALYGAFPQPLEQLHLHVINCTSTYFPTSDYRRAVFYNLLNDESSFGILSTKSMPKISSFPIFMKDGKSEVDVKPDYEMLILSKDDIESLKRFHFLLFNEIIPVIKSFMLFDNENLENSFLIVPLNDKKEINWDIVRTYQSLEWIMPSRPFHFKTSDYELALISPTYRSSMPNIYIVTRVCDDLTPESCFPDKDFEKLTHYYKEKYGLTIENLEQSLLDVKSIPIKINYTKPRKLPDGPLKYKNANDDTVNDIKQYFIPELCWRINFPAIYWIKATTLPSILHRVSQLLIAEDQRVTIAKEIELGSLTLNEWSPLKLEEETEKLKKKDSSKRLDLTVDDTVIHDTIKFDLNVFELSDCNSYLTDQEPQDIYRNMEEIQKIDIRSYSQFMSKKNNVDENDNVQENTKENVGRYITRSTVSTPSLKILVPSEKISVSCDSNLVEIVHAFTTKVAADMFNLERLAILGDSYIKFITSLFLYHEFPMFNEGPLTALKEKIIGNRNLYYCGHKKGIPGRIKNNAYDTTNFIAPAYTVPRPLQKKLLDKSVALHVLNEFKISKEEKFTGQINEETRNMMQQIVLKWDEQDEWKNDFKHYLGVQILSDKTVADSVKALIGVYLKNNDIKCVVKLLEWFGILPNKQIDKLLDSNPPDPILGSGDPNYYMPWADSAEIKFGYKFKNRAYLLQAFTHPSYTANEITECYQRLEFLGDAILDFLITCYIYENCGNLSPDDLTNLRSALVNNITFACLAVKYGLHTALLAYASKLHEAIDRFVKYQEEQDYVINDELLYMLLEEEEYNLAEDVDVPIILADLFKSLIGAMYLDSGKNLAKIWEIVYSFMHKEIGEFSKNVPKQPVQLIYENTDAHPKFLDAMRIEGTKTIMVPLKVTIAGKENLFRGFGLNKKQATCSASKQALKRLHLEK